MFRDPVGYRIKTLNNLMKRHADRHFGHKPDKTTVMHGWIMGFLQNCEEQGQETFQKDIEVEFSMNRSTTSEMLKLMATKGMIERVAVSHDGRLKKLILTEKGREHNRRINEMFKRRYAELVDGLTEEEINQFGMIADKLINNLKRVLDQA